jgi:diguanylate cyclase (GGDEF)-like protein
MTKESPDRQRATFPEDPHQPTPPWSEVQENLAAKAGLSLLLVEGVQPPELAVSNNNSICQAIQSSSEHATLCDPFCGDAHRRARDAGGVIAYRCHAGLHCFATPVKIGSRDDLAVIGGRAFLEISEYRKTIERFRSGDLQDLFAQETFDNVIFGTNSRLDELARNLQRNLRDYNNSIPDELVAVETAAPEVNEEVAEEVVPVVVDSEPPTTPELEKEIQRLRGQLDHQTRLATSLQYFLEQISSSDPAETYLAALTNSKDLLQAERASLFLYDETTDKLTVKAAIGIPGDIADVSSLRLGEGIAGETLESRRPLVVRDLEAAGMQPAPTERLYKTKSFISYPITVSGRRVGVLNVTDKSGGGNYDEIDLSLLEIVAPQLALALERAEWQAKATQFQLMSITDPLTGLHNRRYLEDRLTEEVSRSKRYEQPLSFLMIDIDDFKLYNDRNGHQAGDVALQITAQGLKSSLRSADVAARYGGEEFCVLLPQTSLPEAGVIAERMREKIERTQFPHAQSQPLGAVTISIGVSTFNLTVSTAEQIIWAADRALYEAKHEGKNKIAFDQDLEWKATGSK